MAETLLYHERRVISTLSRSYDKDFADEKSKYKKFLGVRTINF